LAAAVGQHLAGEDVLADPGSCEQDPLGFQVRPHAAAVVLGDLVAQARFEDGDVKFFLAEQRRPESVLTGRSSPQTCVFERTQGGN